MLAASTLRAETSTSFENSTINPCPPTTKSSCLTPPSKCHLSLLLASPPPSASAVTSLAERTFLLDSTPHVLREVRVAQKQACAAALLDLIPVVHEHSHSLHNICWVCAPLHDAVVFRLGLVPSSCCFSSVILALAWLADTKQQQQGTRAVLQAERASNTGGSTVEINLHILHSCFAEMLVSFPFRAVQIMWRCKSLDHKGGAAFLGLAVIAYILQIVVCFICV
mmetsp:Transcript_44030/g.103711  ORF Transcript_44030/g.103711 Transcript_44030/m.103711 type:complete len:224 (-) Transcript_44030:22-693(-)